MNRVLFDSPGPRPTENGSVPFGVVALLLVVGLIAGVLLAQLLPGFQPGGEKEESGHDPSVLDIEHNETADLYTCSMHPEILEREPGTCPICSMDLVPVTANVNKKDSAFSAEEEMAGDHSVVHVDPAVVQNLNVRTEVVSRRDLSRQIKTVGYLEYDQQRMVTVTTKFSGWVEKVYVNYVGEEVRRDQPLFEIYSPELVQTEQELLSALEFAREMAGAPEDARRRAESMVESARTRLGYWDISAEQIEELERTGQVFRSRTVRAPASGLVMKRTPGLEGMAVSPGVELFHIADLNRLWVSVELFEDQLAWVKEGTPASISLSYFPGESFEGTVRFLEPELSERTRTMRAKIEVANRGARLRKGMYATVEFLPVQIPDALTVPRQAVLRTGHRNVVVLALGNGGFVPREVVLGQEIGEYTEVLSGLEGGEEVVTSSQFLLDSESTLRAAIQTLVGEGAADGEAADMESMTDHSGHQH